jgi:RNA polymerase sigma factor (sigma-70 family)
MVRVASEQGRAAHVPGDGEVVPPARPEPDFVAFVDAVKPALERLLKRLAPPTTDPFDLAAEALARTYARWTALGDVENKKAWVMRVATNLAYDARTRGARREEAAARHAGRRHEGPEFENDIANRELLRPALLSLPRRQRDAIALRYLADLPMADVARAMGVSPETARTHVERGRQALRNALGGRLPKEVEDGDE